MNKLLVALLSLNVAAYSYATDYSKFQEFNNQFNFGYGFSQSFLKNGTGSIAGVSQQSYNLDGLGSGASAFNQMPNLGGLNGKVGYAFAVIPDTLSLTPYALIGRNTNLSASTAYNNKDANVSNDFYYTGGVGGRVGYNVANFLNVYADGLVAYNWDQSGPLGGIPPQNNMVYTATLGAKFNVYKQLQLGVNGFYSLYQNMASLPQDTTGTSIYAPCNCGSYGGVFTVGLNY